MCTSCLENEYLEEGRCVSCDEHCQTCYGPYAHNCLSCTDDLELFNGYCHEKQTNVDIENCEEYTH